jgi:ribosomal peptide maturation radical SAM protein 1
VARPVLLVSMPFGALERQALGLSLLKARLAQQGHTRCDVRYLTFPFAELIGDDEYRWVSYDLPYTTFATEWVFASALYATDPSGEDAYLREVLQEEWQLDPKTIARVERIREMVPPFLEYCLKAIPWGDYALVGFTSTFQQNLASLALAKAVKRAHPRVAIAFGGGNWSDEMGLELHRQFPFVDYACIGEADDSFPVLVERVLGGAPRSSLQEVKGVVYRSNGRSVYTGPVDPVCDLDSLPIPDYSDYFRDLADSSAATFVAPTLLFEGSRGCWWGAKSQCTFCGLPGAAIGFRAKSPFRALRELEYLTDRWQVGWVEAVDNILYMPYLEELLPHLANWNRQVRFFFEIKSNLRRDQVARLRDARVLYVQPGIESLSDHVLRLMRKGTTALRNIQILKWCREYGIRAEWNLLYGFPGETRDDYAAMVPLLRGIRFLNPPTACGRIRVDRFSPYFREPEKFGLTSLRPLAAYKHLYPFGPEAVSRIAYHFDYDYEPDVDPHGCADEVIDYAEDWRQHPETGTLRSTAHPDGTLVLADTRSDRVQPEVVLRGIDREVYEYCDQARSLSAVVRHLHRVFPNARLAAAQVRRYLDALTANCLMVTSGGQYLSLALRAHADGGGGPGEADKLQSATGA